MLRHMHSQVGTSQGSAKPPPDDAQVEARGEAEGGMIKALVPQNLAERLGAALRGVSSPG